MRVLVAEDNETTSLLVGRMLTQAGYTWELARDGEEALQKALTGEEYDAILTDWLMPKLDGLGLIREVRAQLEEPPPMVVLTAVASDKARYEVLDAGADHYLAKPVQASELISCLTTVVERSRRTPRRDKSRAVSNNNGPVSSPGLPVVVISAGAGGPMVIQKLMQGLRLGDKAVFLIIQQGPNWMLETFVHRLQTRTELDVRLAAPGKALKTGQVLVLPSGDEPSFSFDGRSLSFERSVPNSEMAAPTDRLLFSASEAFGNRCVAVVLTGSGCDGAEGARTLGDVGGTVLVQDPKSAEVRAMPRSALALCSQAQVVGKNALSEAVDNAIMTALR